MTGLPLWAAADLAAIFALLTLPVWGPFLLWVIVSERHAWQSDRAWARLRGGK